MEIHFLDVGQGDAVFINLPGNKNMLIDCGPPGNELESYLRHSCVFSIDTLVITHVDIDHIGGLKNIIEHFNINTIYLNIPDKDNISDKENEILQILIKLHPDIKTLYRDDKLLLSGNHFFFSASTDCYPRQVDNIDISTLVKTRVLNPPNQNKSGSSNENSIVLQIWYNNFSAMFTGDINKKTEYAIADSVKKCNVLKIPHHGSKNSSSLFFLKKTLPDIAVISVGANNKFGHPDKFTLNKLLKIGSKIYRTDQSGMITITTDGNRYQVEEYLK